MGRGNVISKETIESNPGCYPVFSSSATGDGIIGHYAEYMFDDERISWSIDGGGKFFYHPISRYSVTNVSGWIKVHKQDEISTRFLYLALDAEWQTKHFDYQTKAHPSVIKNEYTVIYPAIDKQHEITTTIASCENHIAALQALITKYEAIKKATVNLLLEPGAGWQKIKFGDVCSSFEYGVGAPAMSFDGRNKYIRITDIDDNSHEFKPTPLSSPTFFDNNHVVRDGDILLARTGASVGKSYLYRPIDGKLIFAGFLIRASICTKIADPQFVFLQTLTSRYRHWVSEESMRSGQPGLNINQYKDFELYLPELI